MKIMIADDHALVREGLYSLIKTIADDVEILQAKNSQEILEQGASGMIDLLLLDIDMPGIGNVKGVSRICAQLPSTAIIVLSGNEAPHIIHECMATGVMGFIPKSTANQVTLNAIRLVLSGDRYMPLTHLDRKSAIEEAADHVTPRQKEIWRFLSRGLSNKEIARELDLTEGTVKQHISALFRKLGIRSRVEAIQKAREIWD